MELIIITILTLTLILLSGFCSLAESSIVALNSLRVKVGVRNNYDGYDKLLELLEFREKYISTILILNTAVNIIFSSYIGGMLSRAYSGFWVGFGTFILTMLVLLFAEIGPKIYAANNPEKVSRLLYPITKLVFRALTPITKVISSISKLWADSSNANGGLSIHDVEYIIHKAESRGMIHNHEKNIVLSLLSKKVALDKIAVPLDSLVCLEGEGALVDYMPAIIGCPYTKILLRNGDGEISGVLDKMSILGAHISGKDISVEDFAHDIPCVSTATSISELFQIFLKSLDNTVFLKEESGEPIGAIFFQDFIHAMTH